MTEELFYRHFEGYKKSNPWQVSPDYKDTPEEEAMEVIFLETTSKITKID